MRKIILTLCLMALVLSSGLSARAQTRLILASPLDYQVFQRSSKAAGKVVVAGRLEVAGAVPAEAVLEGRLTGKSMAGELSGKWEALPLDRAGKAFHGQLQVPAGGWYVFEVRLMSTGRVVAEFKVDHVGVGEIFIVIGQSNSANHGSEKQKPASGLVSAFDTRKWGLANDPQPGASGGGGSFMPAFGDAMVEKIKVPVAVVAAGIGATSVREWLPKGSKVKQLTTTGGHLKAVGPGEWECTGEPFESLAKRLECLGTNGCRAVLWHQGESDAGQARAGYPADRQITGRQYREYMEKVIKSSREKAGWEVPWITAQVSYHSEKDASDEEFRGAQKSLWDAGVAIEGPDTDALRAEYRDGVHFNGKGLKKHGQLWAEKVSAWMEKTVR